jgi:hypothetical protein
VCACVCVHLCLCVIMFDRVQVGSNVVNYKSMRRFTNERTKIQVSHSKAGCNCAFPEASNA